jgi:hypothetical protein
MPVAASPGPPPSTRARTRPQASTIMVWPWEERLALCVPAWAAAMALGGLPTSVPMPPMLAL